MSLLLIAVFSFLAVWMAGAVLTYRAGLRYDEWQRERRALMGGIDDLFAMAPGERLTVLCVSAVWPFALLSALASLGLSHVARLIRRPPSAGAER